MIDVGGFSVSRTKDAKERVPSSRREDVQQCGDNLNNHTGLMLIARRDHNSDWGKLSYPPY